MDILKKYAGWLSLLVLVILLALGWWLQPERQVRRAQKRLIAALQSRDMAALERMVADDYRDRWGHNKANVTTTSSDVFRQFLFITVTSEEKSLTFRGDEWVLAAQIKLQGTGGPLAMYAKDEVNRLTRPFEITWRKNGGPTKWIIATVEQPELDLRN